MARWLIIKLWRYADGRGYALSLYWPAPLAAHAIGVIAAGAYAVFSGWGLPAQRTICMLATVSILKTMGQQWPWTACWALAAMVVTAFNPWSLLQPGFWLSFVAVGVLMIANRSETIKTKKNSHTQQLHKKLLPQRVCNG